MRTIFLALATIALATPAPAAAQAAQQADAANSQAPRTAKPQKYCIKDETTGSRISGQTCKTKAEWALDGIDIDKLIKG